MNHYWFSAAILATQSFVIYQLSTLGGTMSDQQQSIDALTTQVDHVYTEVTAAAVALNARLDDLQAQIDAGVPAADLDLTALAAGIQKLDDLTPDDVDVTPADEEPTV
jgi:hypothetical protein